MFIVLIIVLCMNNKLRCMFIVQSLDCVTHFIYISMSVGSLVVIEITQKYLEGEGKNYVINTIGTRDRNGAGNRGGDHFWRGGGRSGDEK